MLFRSAYDHALTPVEEKQLATDPSWFAEIYVMKADGTEQKRLTTTPGYDGGPFFTPDGKKILWRRFDESGLIADVWMMNPDGSGKTQVTDFKSMSWAPYMHASGEYILFASNKLGFENFELFIVDTAGTKEPVRVTYTDGFDSLPVFSPDGTQLSWTSTRSGGEEGQIFLAFGVLYGIGRSLLEIIRDDAERGAIGPLSTSQAIGIVTAILAAGIYYYRLKNAPPADGVEFFKKFAPPTPPEPPSPPEAAAA